MRPPLLTAHGTTLINAQTLCLAGDVEAAHERRLAVLEARGDDLPLLSVDALTLLGQIAWSTGDREGSQDWYRQAISTLTGVGADREAAQVWFEIGTLADQAGLVAESADAFRRAAVSTGMHARLPVINTPPASSPRTTPEHAPAGRVPVINTPPATSPRTTPAQSPSSLV